MANKIWLSFLFCLSFLLSPIISAQEGEQRLLLRNFLLELENKHNVKFSYADEQLDQISIGIPPTQELSSVLKFIEEETQLLIEKLSERYYAIAFNDRLQICATVLDNFERNTVMGATIEVLGGSKNLITDENGFFSITDVPKDAALRISYLGYRNLIVKASELTGKQPCKTLLLAQFYQQLEEVTVYEFLTKGLVKQEDGSIRMNSEEFGVLPGLLEPDVLQTVQALPGIESVDETVSDINIRGGSNDQNLILWDGIKMYQSGHFFGLISAFNPYLTDKVSLIKNGTSSTYGDGVSGIVDIQTNNSLSEDFYGGAGFNLIGADTYGHLPLTKKLGFQFSARRSLTDVVNTPTYEKFFTRVFDENEVSQDGNFYFYDVTGKLLYDLTQDQKLRFSFINIHNTLDYSETEMESGDTTQSSLDQSNYSVGLHLESGWTDQFSSHLNAYFTNYELGARNTTSNGLQVLFQKNEVQELSAKLHTKFQTSEFFQWHNGYQFTETAIGNQTDVSQPPFASNERNVVRTHALFTEVVWEPENEKMFLRGGLRFNLLENPNSFKESIIEPRLSFNYDLGKDFNLQVLGEFKSQATNQILDLEQNFLGIEKRRWIVSDGETLPVTKSKQASVGLNYDTKNLYMGLEGFYKLVDGISTATQGFQNQNQFNGEIGEYEVKGVEFLVNAKTDIFSLWASYTYNLNNYTFGTYIPPTFPNNLDIRHTASLAGTYTVNQLKLGIGLNYRSGRPFTQPDPENPVDTTFFPTRINYNVPNSSRLREYLRADASAIYNFQLTKGVKASAGVSVLNFTSRKNILNTYYQLNTEDEIEAVTTTSLGITPNASFRVRF
ncbi:carboxypeptidase-like regulatory domain-containing protein [Cytophaga sp. FL35]|uniref:TonB-dependent receptor n=1 Tax=Cytophaga sp. FL35 TaxID=1904456 RepID=UPI001653C276|nr:carboxypeptidase-like regulatory domain-containing protein [Cytophaga sp. FL35]MBC6998079.1 carboxypeptidase-like regulatory domain-containing protein [Cytophaga sp. FL35]